MGFLIITVVVIVVIIVMIDVVNCMVEIDALVYVVGQYCRLDL